MSKEREVLASNVNDNKTLDEVVKENPELSRYQKKARLVSVLDRGITSDRLKVDLPPNLHGEWVRNTVEDRLAAETLGFKVDTEYAPKRAIHTDGAEAAIVGDVVFMVCDKETKELIDEIRHEETMRANSPKNKRHQEENEYRTAVERETGGIIPVLEESKTEAVSGTEINAALEAASRST